MLTLATIVIIASAGLVGSVFLALNTLCNVLLTAPAEVRVRASRR